MRQVIYILALFLLLPALVSSALAEPKILTHDGSLVIQNPEAKQAKKPGGTEDTLYELLGQEVQVYIFNNKTRVWPRVYARSAPLPFKGSISPKDPWIDALIRKYSQIYGVDPYLVRAVMRHESGFNAGAESPKGAQGLMQLMPGTAAQMGVRNPFDPEQNIAGGVGYLRRCLDRFQHNVPLAVAAYNAGPESVAKCGTIPPYQETQNFVANVMGSYGGPSQTGNTKAAAAPKGQTKEGTSAAKAEELRSEKTPVPPRHPHPKIIEVRPQKAASKETAVE
jgi:soluble lytic murein transglycosylase-like protein